MPIMGGSYTAVSDRCNLADTRGLLARVRKLERSHGATEEMRGWVNDTFGAAIADGRVSR